MASPLLVGAWRHHFVIRVAGRLAGFAVVCQRARFAGPGVREIGEFFVWRCHRRGVGTRAARTLFARFPGHLVFVVQPFATTKGK